MRRFSLLITGLFILGMMSMVTTVVEAKPPKWSKGKASGKGTTIDHLNNKKDKKSDIIEKQEESESADQEEDSDEQSEETEKDKAKKKSSKKSKVKSEEISVSTESVKDSKGKKLASIWHQLRS